MTAAAIRTIRVTDPDPYGDVTLAPEAMTGRSEIQMARAMADALVGRAPASAAQVLQHLRNAFPQAPLTVRVAALGALMRR